MKILYHGKIFLILLLTSFNIYAQGTLRGIVADSLTGEHLYGANVFLVGTALGSATNIEGEFKIPNISGGTHLIKVSYIGYKVKEFEIDVQNNKTTQFDVVLVPDIIEGETVVVTGQAMGQIAAINQQRSSNTIINVVSEEKIKELPDANAAEAIGRLPGVSILRSGGEANKIILRGLEDKFTNITIDGIKIPPTDATSRGVDLSMISQSSLSGIELFKAITPDKDGDALAGSVNLVTRIAPEERKIRTDLKGDYNHIMSSFAQYDFSLHYGERFFNNILGVQFIGNLENKIRSNEHIEVNYNQGIVGLNGANDYLINDFVLEFTDEIRKRNGATLLLDLKTPDNGTIRINNVYSGTNRDYLLHSRDYPTQGGGDQQGSTVYQYRDREQDINTFNSSIRGDNYLFDLSINWGLSFAQSKSEYPFDYEAIFVESNGMRPAPVIKENPEQLISYAMNNFSNANLYWHYYRQQDNFDKEKTAFLDIAKKYALGDLFSGELKIGGKYKVKNRSNIRDEDFTPYYLGKYKTHTLSPDGSVIPKDFSNTYFADWQNQNILFVPIANFINGDVDRDVYDSYLLNPLIDRDRLRQWWDLNKNGVDATGFKTVDNLELWNNPLIRYDDYNVTERIAAGYLMNTFNVGQSLTVIAGVRVEDENNDYISTYMTGSAGGFPVRDIAVRDTTSSAKQTVVLPNINIAFKPFDFINIRLAVYKALARPDFNMRIDRYISGRPAEVGGQPRVYVGNPNLKTAEAWNYEVNTSFYGNEIGLISLSGYYKEIDDMYHIMDNFNTVGDTIMQRFGILWPSRMRTTPYNLTLPYNSPKPTKVWGFEFEHQINFQFLPGLLRNIVLSYNASIVRSETIIYGSQTISYVDSSGPFPLTKSRNILVERKQKLEGMPEFFGNISLGYDIGDFSGRISLFYQGEHNASFSASGLGDRITDSFTRLDLALKYKLFDYLSIFLNLNNLTNIEEGRTIYNRVYDRKLFDSSEKYGLTGNFGATVEL